MGKLGVCPFIWDSLGLRELEQQGLGPEWRLAWGLRLASLVRLALERGWWKLRAWGLQQAWREWWLGLEPLRRVLEPRLAWRGLG